MKPTCSTAVLAALILSLSAGTPASAQSGKGTRLQKTFKIGSDGGWDYLTADHQHNRIYVSHGTQVNVLDERTGDSVGVIANTPGVHGIALVPSLNKGYTSNGKSGECTVFDMTTLAVTGKIRVGENPDAIFYDDFSKNIFVFNGRSMDVSVIDPTDDKVVATLLLGGKPETGVSDGKGNIFVNIEDKNEVVNFSAQNPKIIKRYKLDGGEEPAGLAIDRKNLRLFVGCSNKVLLVLDARTGKKISTLPIGEGSDGVVFDPQLKRIYSANGEGTLTVITELSMNKFEILENVKTVKGARTIALDATSHHVFLPTANFKPGTDQGKRAPVIPGTFRILDFAQ
jgi:YVTN family beta-propeller protein